MFCCTKVSAGLAAAAKAGSGQAPKKASNANAQSILVVQDDNRTERNVILCLPKPFTLVVIVDVLRSPDEA